MVDLSKYHIVELPTGSGIVKHFEMYWKITLEEKIEDTEDTEDIDIKDLPGTPYDEEKDYSPKVELREDVQEWLDNNVTGKVYVAPSNLFYFENSADAVAFKLMWI